MLRSCNARSIGMPRSSLVGGALRINRYGYIRHFSGTVINSDANDIMLRDPIIKRNVPQRVEQKIVSASDAVELIRDGDTVAVSGFVAQGAPEAVLKAVGE